MYDGGGNSIEHPPAQTCKLILNPQAGAADNRFVKRALTEHGLMVGAFQRIELKALELLQHSTVRRQALAEFRSEAASVYAEQRSPYIRKRLQRFLAVLDSLEALSADEERQWNLLQRVVTRLQNTDVLDHFGAGLQRRMNQILKEAVAAESMAAEWRGQHWFLFTVGTLHIAVNGRILRHQKVSGRKEIKAPMRLRVFPETDLWGKGALYLTILETDNKERMAIYANAVASLPAFFEPGPLSPVQHPDLMGKIRHAGRTVYIWKPLASGS